MELRLCRLLLLLLLLLLRVARLFLLRLQPAAVPRRRMRRHRQLAAIPLLTVPAFNDQKFDQISSPDVETLTSF